MTPEEAVRRLLPYARRKSRQMLRTETGDQELAGWRTST